MENNEMKQKTSNEKATPWSEERFGLLKLNDATLLKESQKQLGMAKSYIQELEDLLKEQNQLIEQLRKSENKEFRREERKSEMYQQLLNENKSLREKNKQLKTAYDIALSRQFLAKQIKMD